jgi:hypothetical protein
MYLATNINRCPQKWVFQTYVVNNLTFEFVNVGSCYTTNFISKSSIICNLV